MSYWKWVYSVVDNRSRLFDVGIRDDGTLNNPHGYPEDVVRASVLAAEERRHQKRQRAARQAAETRAHRREIKLQAIVKKMLRDESIGPSTHCALCKKELSDPQSLARGIGSECWQGVLSAVEKARRQSTQAAE